MGGCRERGGAKAPLPERGVARSCLGWAGVLLRAADAGATFDRCGVDFHEESPTADHERVVSPIHSRLPLWASLPRSGLGASSR